MQRIQHGVNVLQVPLKGLTVQPLSQLLPLRHIPNVNAMILQIKRL